VLILVIVVALVAAALIGAELYVRKSANDKIKAATTCETQDSADTVSVSFNNSPPLLWQYLSDNYRKITVNTHGTHIRSAQGMTVDVVVDDVRLDGDSTKKGTIGAINAGFTWTTDGILQSVRDGIKDAIPDWLANFVSTDSLVTGVKTDPSAGTITVQGISDSQIVVKPEIIEQPTAEFPNGGIRLTIQPNGFKIPGGYDFPRETLQSTLDEKTSKITENKLGIKPVPPVEITNDAVKLRFSAQNANIPLESTDPCFADL
jgi:hypothetical protein